MHISYIALDRMAAESAAQNKLERAHLEKIGRPILSTGRKMSDVELLKKLQSFNVIVDKEKLEVWCRDSISAQEVAEWIFSTQKPVFKLSFEQDWIWIALTVLWERWFPHYPNFEMIDDQMQAGYDLLGAREAARACLLWLALWKPAVQIANARNLKTLAELDHAFGGTQSFFNWVQDLVEALETAGQNDRRFFYERAHFCEEFIGRFPHEDESIDQNMRHAWAESCVRIGETEKAEAVFQQLHEKYGQLAGQESVKLETTLGTSGNVLRLKRMIDFGDEGLPLEQFGNLKKALRAGLHNWPAPNEKKHKIGRNDPCSCGSGRKFKLCCGK